MRSPERDPSVWKEPHMRAGGFEPDPCEPHGESNEGAVQSSEENRIQHSVWGEPTLSTDLSGAQPDAVPTYSRWLRERRARTSPAGSWLLTMALAAAAGPLALVGALWGSGQTIFSLLSIVLFTPIVEETMKAAVAFYVVEERPYLFRSPTQIVVCVLTGAFVFAAVENLLYLNIHVRDASAALVQWRWTVCVALHVCASALAAIGLVRVWNDVWRRPGKARIALAGPWLIAAMILHGTYNAAAVVMDVVGYRT